MNEQTSQHGIGSDLRSLRRSRDERMVAGVLGGLARRLGIDPVILRIITAVLAIFGGVGVIIYALGWLLIPEDGEERSLGEKALSRGGDSPEPATLWLAGGLALAVIIATGTTFSSGVGPVLLVLAGAGVVVMLRQGDDTEPQSASTEPPGGDDPLGAGTSDDPVSVTPPDTAPPGGLPGEAHQDRAEGGDGPHGDGLRGDEPSRDDDLPNGGELPGGELSGGDSSVAGATASPYSLSGTSTHAWPEPPDWPASDVREFGFEPPEPPAEPDRRSGSHLGSVTLCAVLVAVGILAIADANGAAVPAPAYVIVALAIIGLGLLVGTWFGRARGLIVLGMLGTFIALPVTLVGETVGWEFTGEDRIITIDDVAQLPEDAVSHGIGRVRYDLSELEFTDDPVELEISQKVGSLQIVVPTDVDVTLNASTGMGHIAAFDEQAGGHQDITLTDVGPDGAGGGELTLDLALKLGEITVERAGEVSDQPRTNEQRAF